MRSSSANSVRRNRRGVPGNSTATLSTGDVVKVRYGADNGEVEGTVLATRLLWALGFGADGAYPVRLVCHGCSDDPWNKRGCTQSSHTFDIATIERSHPGTKCMAARMAGAGPTSISSMTHKAARPAHSATR